MADELRRLIRVRTEKGARFKRDGFGKKRQLADSWRKPRGQHNKQREQKKAKGALPKPGFGSPVAIRGMHPSGFFEVLVHTVDDLEGLNPKTQSIRIGAKVGNRKRALIQEKALAAGLRVLNARAEKPKKKVVAAAKEEQAKKQEEKKVKKAAPERKADKKAATVTQKPSEKKKTEKKAAPAEGKAPTKKKAPEKEAQEQAGPEPAEKPPKKETPKKTQKAAVETAAEPKQKKASRAKADSSGEAKPVKKAAAKPKKKTVKEGEEQ